VEGSWDGRRRRKWTPTRILSWLGGLMGTLLILMIILNLLAPRLMEHLLLGPTPAPTLAPFPGPPKAAILDQTSVTDPCPDFIKKARAYLREGGYQVEVYRWKELTVDFYRTLPGKGYKLILFQNHSTSEVAGPEGQPLPKGHSPGPFIFTGEQASGKYLFERIGDRIRPAKFLYGDFPLFFAIGPKFVRLSMSGLFPGTVIIIGGCQSLAMPDLAQAFLDRGASVVIGWDGLVDLSHNNKAMLYLLRALTADRLTPQQAVEETMREIGPDPIYGSNLTYLLP